MRLGLISFCSVMALSSAVQAGDVALILGTDSYEVLGRLDRGAAVLSAQEGLSGLGFDVAALRNGRADTSATVLRDFARQVEQAERRLVILSGRFATDGSQSWYLTSETKDPDVLTIGRTSVDLASIMRILGDAPGQSLLLIGTDSGADVLGPWLRSGLVLPEIAQGVTVAVGSPRDVAAFADEVLSQPQIDIMPYFSEYGLAVSGYAPKSLVLMPQRPSVVPAPAAPPVDTSEDDALWQGASALDTVEAYRNYISRFPNGLHAAKAEQLIADILAEPNRPDRMIEDALSLSRDQRREIQRHLTILDYNTRGIDGIFGSGTRSAILNWQQQNGYSQTSYLTAEQITRLEAQAARRAAELEAEAERRRREVAQIDRAYWEETGAKGDEPGLRTYIERYPDGIFAELATERLAKIEDAKREAAQAEDRSAWDNARSGDTVASYQDYLSLYPEGDFVSDAQARIATLIAEQEDAPELAAAEAQEEALGLNTISRRLIESRLSQMELEPGEVDGVFDDATRRAIRRYQESSGIPVTGYLDEATVVRLLADAVNDISGR